jgi:hypothetical protein
VKKSEGRRKGAERGTGSGDKNRVNESEMQKVTGDREEEEEEDDDDDDDG